jgi:hypothetical protein
MRELEEAGVASFPGKKKRGPQKCPDFFCVDPQGRFHIIECKGNQGGRPETEDQFKRGREQKANILFANEQLVGQRMLTGLAIANPNSKWKTQLIVTDPPPENAGNDALIVSATESREVVNAIKRVACLDGLLLAGYFGRARNLLPEAGRVKRIPGAHDQPHSEFESNDAAWLGQVHTLAFPVPLKTFEGDDIAGVRLKFGVSPAFLEATEGGVPNWDDLALGLRRNESLPGSQRRSFIGYGNAFIAEIELL